MLILCGHPPAITRCHGTDQDMRESPEAVLKLALFEVVV
jgi:hypothetical protein